MNRGWRTFLITLIVVVGLIILGFLPSMTFGTFKPKKVEMFSDLKEQDEEEEEKASDDDKEKGNVETDASGKTISFADDHGEKIIDFTTDEKCNMETFYAKLKALKEDPKKTVRIGYFGDSFIEGDILTCDIRDSLQERFGGGGLGMYDVSSNIENNRGTITQKSEGFEIIPATKDSYDNERGSLNLHYCVPTSSSASVTYEKTGFTKNFRKHNSDFKESTIFFSTDVAIDLKGTLNDSINKDFHFNPSGDIQHATVSGNFDKVKWTVNSGGERKSWFYSVALDKGSGVVVDNISLRGSDGSCIKDVSDKHMDQMAKLRPYDLIIVGFGLNFASESRAKNGYKDYKEQTKAVIAKLRRHYPNTPIMLVSVSDRCQRNGGGITTMPCIKSLVEAQFNLAHDAHTAFWNLFQGMGGENSMRRMADDNSGARKANKDYTHITYDGGRVIARSFLKALLGPLDEKKK